MDKNVMHNIGYGLYVLTAKENDKQNGCIINTLIQLTSTPNRVSIAVNKQNYTHDMILRTGKFNVSLLTENTPFDVFKNFGFQSGRDCDKFADFKNYKEAANGINYIIDYTNSYLSATVESTIDLGTHTLFIALVDDGEVLSKEPSLTYAYYHKNIKPRPEKTSKKGWRCKICGYIYEGETLPNDFVCPICKHGAEDFEKIE